MSDGPRALRAMSKKLLAQAAELEVLAQQLEQGDTGTPEPTVDEAEVPVLTPCQQRLHDHFKRRPTTAWTRQERRAYVAAAKGKTKEQWEAEIEEVLQDQGSRGEYHTRSLVTLLNQWGQKVDEARTNADMSKRTPRRPML